MACVLVNETKLYNNIYYHLTNKIMKAPYSFLFLLTISFFAISFFSSCDIVNDSNDQESDQQLTETETNDLKFLREEEKLARDVYLNLYSEYGLNIFNNIASSEQKHMDAVLNIMQQHNIADPASIEHGIFNNPDLQTLYDNLTAQAGESLVAALKVGATIEDVDIKDLQEAILSTSHSNISDMYQKLECGSRNHMRAFVGQLDALNESYEPQFITSEEFADIINSSNEQCGH